ncbi:hydantoinase/oxoprolinase family protein (plasmid) [Halococcus dombrowskii]|uniref:Hydantoinase/oxoprolinase family protein n=1 Tax=Halococcus dombrowskii TaxID=179637 RepID=A0AAV3SLA8_HALDO|nr:hydantoinase/oxoprolinase family protein [Halococcus dombrowskii]UOO96992.1 hydantoinase/oxoprolinase family protein [Halococcus dombrowskii]
MAQSEDSPSEGRSGEMLLSIDAGGTMTDTFLMDRNGEFTVGKAKTTPDDESRGFVKSSADALDDWDMDVEEGFPGLVSTVYSGTAMLNRLVERESEVDVGILITGGMEDTLRMGRGRQSYTGYSYSDRLHVNTHKHPEPLIPRNQIRGVRERIDVKGNELIPMYEDDVQESVNSLLDQDVDHITVMFLHSYKNDTHEQRTKEIAEEIIDDREADTSVMLSSEYYPTLKESERLNTLAAEAFAAEPSRAQLKNIQDAVDDRGGDVGVRVVASHGGTIDIHANELARTLISGPIGGMIGSNYFGKELGYENLVCTDIGGTSFDMGILIDNDWQINYSPEMARLLLALPMVNMDSVGSGTGSYVRVNPTYNKIELGPESAGDQVGVCATETDVETVTVTDCHVALGWIDPDNFLGGDMKIDRDVAEEAIKQQVADPLDMSVYEAAQGVVDILENKLRNDLQSVVTGEGYAPSNFKCLSYGGGGPVHTAGYTEDLGFDEILIPEWAAGFSAFGCGAADYEYRYDQTTSIDIDPDLSMEEAAQTAGEELTDIWTKLEERVEDEFANSNISRDEIDFKHHILGQYQGQLNSIDIQSPVNRADTEVKLEKLLDTYEENYRRQYSEEARSPEFGHTITQASVRGVRDVIKPEIPTEEKQGPEPPEDAYKESRETYWDGEWLESEIYDLHALQPGNELGGPAVLEGAATTFVVPPEYETWVDEHRVHHLSRVD